MDILPLFSSDYSVGGRSCLCIEPNGEIDFGGACSPEQKYSIRDYAPVSVTSIAKHYQINPLFIIDNNPTGIVKAYKYFKEISQQFIYGLKLKIVNDIADKTPESLKNESKVIILLNNSNSYSDAIKIYSKAATDGKYYVPRVSWKLLKENWTPNLTLMLPFYDSFLATNLLRNAHCIPDFPEKPIFCIEHHDLPFDGLINDEVLRFCKNNNCPTEQTHSVYYFKESDFATYQTFRAITNTRIGSERATLSCPNIDHFASNKFSFESYLKLVGKELQSHG